MILIQKPQYLPSESPAVPGLTIMMPGLAGLTAEFLVRPSIPYPVTALKTDRYLPFDNLIFHSLICCLTQK